MKGLLKRYSLVIALCLMIVIVIVGSILVTSCGTKEYQINDEIYHVENDEPNVLQKNSI